MCSEGGGSLLSAVIIRYYNGITNVETSTMVFIVIGVISLVIGLILLSIGLYKRSHRYENMS